MGRKWIVACALSAFLGVPAGPAGASSDPLSGHQWALARIQAEQAWSVARGDGSVVAVVDTGVDFGHPDLAGKQAGSFDCFEKNPCVQGSGDPNGHGTAVAGIIASLNNAEGIAPVAPAAKILSVRVLSPEGAASIQDVIRGIILAADQGAKIINLSLAGSPGEPIVVLDFLELCLGPCTSTQEREQFQQAINYAARSGALVVAAAGNENGLDSFYSGMDNVLVVGATGPDDGAAPYSSNGAEIFAPGGAFPGTCGNHVEACILSTVPGGYAAFQGTSFAAPHISGIAALLGPASSPAQTVARIQETAESVPAGRRANARLAVGAAADAFADDPELVPERLGASDPQRAGSAAARAATSKAAAATLSPPLPPQTTVIELAPPPGKSELPGSGSGRRHTRDRADSSSRGGITAATATVAALLVLLSAGGNGAYFLMRRKTPA